MFLTVAAWAADSATLRAGLESSSGWTEIQRKSVSGVGEVVVRHKEVAGQPCLEGSAHTELDADLLLREATDVRNQPSWSSQAVVASEKLTGGSTSFDYYQVLDNPAPVADRFWFLHATSGLVGAARVFTWEQIDAAGRYPDRLQAVLSRWPGAVPTRVNVGDWTFTPTAGGADVRYRICTDAGGNLPGWVGEMAARTALPTNLADIVKRVRALGG